MTLLFMQKSDFMSSHSLYSQCLSLACLCRIPHLADNARIVGRSYRILVRGAENQSLIVQISNFDILTLFTEFQRFLAFAALENH